jgi:hypothetical protein
MTRNLPTKIKPYFDEEKCRYLWHGITVSQVKAWEKLYPDVSIINVLLVDMPRWIDRNKDKAIVKRKKDWKKTICNWLRKEQMKAVGII